MNWIFILEIAVGIAIGIVVSVALLELSCFVADTVKNGRKEKSENLSNPDIIISNIENEKSEELPNPDHIALIIEKENLSKAELKMLENGYIAKLSKVPHLSYIRYYKKEEKDGKIIVRRSALCYDRLIDFETYSKRVYINFDISVDLLKAVAERCKELGWDKS